MKEQEFWDCISLLDWENEGNNGKITAPLIQHLSELPNEKIMGFEEVLSQKLHALDGLEYAQEIGEDWAYQEGNYFSTDLFLYARCCVVANGQEFYESVLKNPKLMPKEIDFEPLLYISSKAYRLKNQAEIPVLTNVSYETFSNKNAWA